MTDAEQDKKRKELGKFQRKAELCRYAHSCLAENARCGRRIIEITLAGLSLFLSVLVIFFYRDVVPEGWEKCVIIGIGFVPLLILFVQTLGRIFGWAELESQHELAVHIWGMWTRDAGFFADKLSEYSEEIAREKLSVIESKYLECMDKTPLIPPKKFLFYKIALRRRYALATKIDKAEGENGELLKLLDKIEQECTNAEKKNRDATKDKNC